MEIKVEEPKNYEQKCPVVFVLDRSGSMEGRPIDELNQGLKKFSESIIKDSVASSRIELAIISYDNRIEILRDFDLIEAVDEMPILEAGGTTATADAVYKAMSLIEEKKLVLQKQNITYYRPYIILLTDGRPDDDQDMEKLKDVLCKENKNKKIEFWAFGVGESANMELLKNIATPSSIIQKINDVDNLGTFFKWLSSSFQKISASQEADKVDLSPKKDENPFTITVNGGS